MKENRPWGWYETIEDGSDYKLKKIYLHPRQRFSLQFHRKRTEQWIVIQGSGVITLGHDDLECKPGDSFTIGIEQRHRAEAGDDGLTFFEVQRGECDECDIVRIEDDYGRTGNSILDYLI
jgi:mannose-6-phosphate isomerase-like protein (cupin superfamily)